MRKFFPVLLAIFLSLPALAQLPANKLEGSWEMVSRRYVYPDSVVTPEPFQGPAYKILNSTHFAFGRQTILSGEPQEDVYAGGGRYSLQKDTVYTEFVEYHSSAGLVGQALVFTCRLDGDLWYHSGLIGDFVLEEVWRRVR